MVLNLTTQERRVILFLVSVALLGTGIDFFLKTKLPVARYIQPDKHSAGFDLNLISQEELVGLPGVSPKLSAKIIAYRNEHGSFKDIVELKEIKGIGEYKYEKLKGLFYIEE